MSETPVTQPAQSGQSPQPLTEGAIVYSVRSINAAGDWAAPRMQAKVGLLRVEEVATHQWATETGEKVMALGNLQGGFACHSHKLDGKQTWFLLADPLGPEIPAYVLRDWEALGGISAGAAEIYRGSHSMEVRG
jgi:hypothetical protein